MKMRTRARTRIRVRIHSRSSPKQYELCDLWRKCGPKIFSMEMSIGGAVRAATWKRKDSALGYLKGAFRYLNELEACAERRFPEVRKLLDEAKFWFEERAFARGAEWAKMAIQLSTFVNEVCKGGA